MINTIVEENGKDRKIVKYLTMTDARKLPGMLGAMVPYRLKIDGNYCAIVGGEKTEFVLKNQ